MKTCPFCTVNLSQADLESGKCPRCQQVLPIAEQGASEGGLAGALPRRGTEAGLPSEPAAPAGEERPILRTFEAVGGGAGATLPPDADVPAPAERDRGTADEERIAQTLRSGGAADASAAKPPTAEDSHRYAPTIDTAQLAQDVVARVSLLWSGKFDEAATPRTSIKTPAQTVEEESNLVIQPRILREAHSGDARRADYELLQVLGEGGMGVVLAARQASIDRSVALKRIKPAEAQNRESREKFLSEAVVTGDLEHPNIVPIYDLGKDDAGVLFYSMKHVKGTPWDKVLSLKTFQENLEIWMKVADAVAFAHSRGVVHRDLKPENVMLGDFGEVLLMDWGLAITVGSASAKRAGMAGTPAYMSPEMATGPLERIGLPSDIYLLGAMLYEIVTGKTPHTGTSVSACLVAAAKNEIQPPEKSGELVDIALKAMATEPAARYAAVGELQEAIRLYRSHSESILLSTRADEDLQEAARREDYEAYARAVFGFQEAFELWDGNVRAKDGLLEATLAYARRALEKGDYDLAASLLDADRPEHAPLLLEIVAGQRERDARQRRLKTARRVGVALMATVLVVVTVAFFWIQAARAAAVAAEIAAIADRDRAVAAEQDAKDKEALAKKATKRAEEQTVIAVVQKKKADEQKELAQKAQQLAEEERAKAEQQTKLANEAKAAEEYGAYIARIGLAAAKIEENAFDRAKDLLDECPAKLRNWEWGRLRYLCTQGSRTVDVGQPIEAVAYSPDGKRFATGSADGTARIWDVAAGRKLLDIPTGGQYVFAVAFSPDGNQLATGTNAFSDYVTIWDSRTGALVQRLPGQKDLPGHQDAVLSVAYSRDGKRLLTGSYDNTARLWDLATGRSCLLQGHEWWVCSATFSPDEKRAVTACQDGSVMVWNLPARGEHSDRPLSPSLTFLGHTEPAYTAAFSADNKWVASAGYDKRILLWQADPDAEPKKSTGESSKVNAGPKKSTGEFIKDNYEGALEGHTAGIRSLQFSPDGSLLVSGGYDNTVRVWDTTTRTLLKTLRGHAGRVTSVTFAPAAAGARRELLSGSQDEQVKMWNLEGYKEKLVIGANVFKGHEDAILGAAFSSDGKQILSASRDRTARLWDASGACIGKFQEGHRYLATTAIFFPDGKKFLTTAVDNTTRIWDVTSGAELQKPLEGTGLSAAVALSHDRKRILTGSDDNTAKLWEWDAVTNKFKSLGQTPSHNAEVTAVAFSPNDRLMFTGDDLGHCRSWEWDGKTFKLLKEALIHSRGIKAAFFLPDGQHVLTASSDRTATQWDVATGREQGDRIMRHPGSVTSMALSPDGQQALTTCDDNIVRLWEVRTGHKIGHFGSGKETMNAVSFSPDGLQAVTTSLPLRLAGEPARADAGEKAATSAESFVRLWDLRTFKEVGGGNGTAVRTFREGSAMAWSTIFSPKGGSLLTVVGNEARLWDLKAGRESMVFVPQGAVASAKFSPKEFSPDGPRAVTASWDNSARIWNVDTRVALFKLSGHKDYVTDAVYSPRGEFIATASKDKSAILWDAKTGEKIGTFAGDDGHVEAILSIAFSPDGKRVVTASQDNTAKIWDVGTRKLLRTLGQTPKPGRAPAAAAGEQDGHGRAVLAAVFSPDGTQILTGGADNRAILWDAARGKPVQVLQGHTAAVTSVAFSPDGLRAITGSRDNTAKVWELKPGKEWELKSGKELLTLKGHSQEVTAVAFSSDRKRALTGSLDGTLILWPADEWQAAGAKPSPREPSAPLQARSAP
jgi:WD40 repeat protein